jgi:hypothetical protein
MFEEGMLICSKRKTKFTKIIINISSSKRYVKYYEYDPVAIAEDELG